MRVAIFATMPPDTYSGGRYYSFMLAEALANGGHDVYFVTNHRPIFYNDLAAFPKHRLVNLRLTRDFVTDLPKDDFDFVILTPGGGVPGYYARTEIFAIERNAHLVLINFESGDWFNSLSPTPRGLQDWAPWKNAARFASLVLSISKEGNKWAHGFYKRTWSRTRFNYCYPPTNTPAADAVPDQVCENRLVLFMRFSTSKHKGSDEIGELFCEAMRGYTLVLVMGKEQVPSDIFATLVSKARECGVTLELKYKLTDKEKFAEIKRAKLMLFPSYFEGFGYPPVEAQYCNVPTVAFDLPVLRETSDDRLLFAQHGDWTDFREKIADALRNGRDWSHLRKAIGPVASIETTTERLERILGEILNEGPARTPALASRLNWLRLVDRYRLSDWRIRFRRQREELRAGALKRAARVIRRIQARRPRQHRVTYYPVFDSMEELTSHYYRARWYLPREEGRCEEVDLFSGVGRSPGSLPEYMCEPPKASPHIRILSGRFAQVLALFSSDLVLVWKGGADTRLLKFLDRFCGIKVVNVATDDLNAREYASYCSLMWKWLTRPLERSVVLAENQRRFAALAESLSTEHFERACVFGTGPSFEEARDFEYGRSLNIVCNSIVQNQEMLDYLAPRFICAGDVISHLGVSAYADVFRRDLVRALEERDIIFVTTANFGSLFLNHYPEFTNKVVLLDQTSVGPNFDLRVHFGAPQLDSTLNIHMLPIAATFSKDIWILGCDGKSTERDNEDFWAHAETAQYHDLVDSGHMCHPTFDVHRQMSTYDRFVRSTADTIETGEREHGIRYMSLKPSNIPVLKPRSIAPEAIGKAGLTPPYSLDMLSGLIGRTPARTQEGDEVTPESEEATVLPFRLGMSKCEFDPGGILHVSGWVLAHEAIDRIEVSLDNQPLGRANLRLHRGDVHRKYPEYEDEFSGFQFYTRIEGEPGGSGQIRFKLFSDEKLIATEEAKIRVVSD